MGGISIKHPPLIPMKHFQSILFSFLLCIQSLLYADHPTLCLEDGSPGPITTVSAVPLTEGAVSAAVMTQFIFFDALSDATLLRHSGAEDAVHSTDQVMSASLNAAYGLTDDITLGFSLPYLERTNLREATGNPHGGAGGHHSSQGEHRRRIPRHGGVNHGGSGINTPPTVEHVGDSMGVGDATLYTQYRILHDAGENRSFSMLTGLKTATGRTDVTTSSGALLEAHHQPGSGSWDPLLGIAYTEGMGRWSFDTSALYSLATDGTGDSNLGDVFNYNAAISYRAIGAHLPDRNHEQSPSHGHPTTLDLILEANGDWRDKVVENGDEDGNTGGNVVFLSSGARLSWGCGWAATVSTGVPVLKDLNGIQSEPGLRILVGISRGF